MKEKIIGTGSEKPHFKEGQVVKAPLNLNEGVESTAEELVEWHITMVGKDGLVHIMREPIPEEQQAMGGARRNITLARTCRIEDLAKWN